MKKPKKTVHLLQGVPTDADLEKLVDSMIAANNPQLPPEKIKRKKWKSV